MNLAQIERLLHPVRIHVLKNLAKHKEMTTRELSSVLPDIPTASLYRHLRSMLKDGILEVAHEKQVRGTLERCYRLKLNPFDEIAARMNELDKKELLDLFTGFMVAELSDFAEYLGEDDYPVEKERLGFSSTSLYLDDGELKAFVTAIKGVMADFAHVEAKPGRRLHKFSFTMIPTRKRDPEPS